MVIKIKRNPIKYLIIFFAIVWVLSIVVFGISFLIATKFLSQTIDSNPINNPSTDLGMIVSVVVGVISFLLMIFVYVIDEVLKHNLVKSNKSIFSKITFIPRLFLVLAFLPLIITFKIISNKQSEIFKRVVLSLFCLIFLGTIWAFGYAGVFTFTKDFLGLTFNDINISATGSMYPTWPKGSKGKDPKELAKEIVSSAGFLPYPNGLEFNGKRYLNHKIGNGDIVTAENDAIRKNAEKIYGSPSGVLKRIVALGGQQIEIKDGVFYINDIPQIEQYTAKPRSTFGGGFLKECQKVTVPDDSVFLMGDNRKGSGDSREFGFVMYTDIKAVLPYDKQIGNLDKNWRDATSDQITLVRPQIDKIKFVDLLNQKRIENGAKPVKYQPKLDESARIRGESILKSGFTKEVSFDVVSNAMSKAGYWNTYVWEWPIEGYYEADELIEDYIERDSTDAKKVWFDKELDDIGLAEVQGELNGCPTQIIVIHSAGYIPPNYKQADIDSWKPSIDGLRNIQSGWLSLKDNTSFYNQNKADIDRINEIISIRITRIDSIISTMQANKWLSTEQNKWIKEDQGLYNEQQSLADKLNSK